MSPLDTPSRLKGIETHGGHESKYVFRIALDTPSRLKGIETHSGQLFDLLHASVFGYTFPFEGN